MIILVERVVYSRESDVILVVFALKDFVPLSLEAGSVLKVECTFSTSLLTPFRIFILF